MPTRGGPDNWLTVNLAAPLTVTGPSPAATINYGLLILLPITAMTPGSGLPEWAGCGAEAYRGSLGPFVSFGLSGRRGRDGGPAGTAPPDGQPRRLGKVESAIVHP